MEIYKNKVANLVERIEGIITDRTLDTKVKQSELIMEELRKEYILLPSEYVNSFLYTRDQLDELSKIPLSLDFINSENNDSKTSHQKLSEAYNDSVSALFDNLIFNSDVTINPEKIVDEKYPNETIIIRGNSFGPFNPEEYFKSDIKILWLLKESYITKSSWIRGDRGGHNQAFENHLWDNIVNEDNKTLINLIHRTQTIINELNNNGTNISEQVLMSSICILEMNHFPGLAFNNSNSKKNYIEDWSESNLNLLKILIKFYEPSIVISGGVHDCYYYPWFKETFIDANPFEKLGFTLNRDFIKDNTDCLIHNYILPVEEDNGPIFIIANHPSRECCYPNTWAKEDGERIRNHNLLGRIDSISN